MSSLKGFLKRENKIVERRKLYFGISLGILALAIVLAIVYGLLFGSPLKLGFDFTGGYSISVKLGDRLNDDNYKSYVDDITKTIEGVKTEDGKSVKVASAQRYGKDDTAGIKFVYKAVGDEPIMDKLGEDIVDVLQKKLFGSDEYSGAVTKSDFTTPSIGSELLSSAIMAVLLAIVLIMIYVAFRFDFVSGLVGIIALLHDLAIMFAFMIIFRIELGSTFIAALLTIVGYSINNTIVVFDRIRESVRDKDNSALPPNIIANRSIRDTMVRSVNTTLTTLVSVLVLAIIGVPSLRIFLLPLIIGLLSGTFSSVLIAPSLWVAVVSKHPDLMQKRAFWRGVREFFAARRSKRQAKRKAHKSKTNIVAQ